MLKSNPCYPDYPPTHPYTFSLYVHRIERLFTGCRVREEELLSEISCSQRHTAQFHSQQVPGAVKFRDRIWNGGCQGPGREEILSCCLMGTAFQFCKMKGILEMGCTTV